MLSRMFWIQNRFRCFRAVATATALASSTLLTGCGPSTEPPESAAQTNDLSATNHAQITFRNVNPVDARTLLTQSNAIVILDVRTPREFSQGHLNGSLNIDYKSATFGNQLAALDRDPTYLVLCAVGGRSTAALSEFRRLGFKSVVHLDGGYEAWRKADLPVTR